MALGAEPGGLHRGNSAFLSTSDLFENSGECSVAWWVLVHVSGLCLGVVPGPGEGRRVCDPCLVRFFDLF